jgi:hypothetical protein
MAVWPNRRVDALGTVICQSFVLRLLYSVTIVTEQCNAATHARQGKRSRPATGASSLNTLYFKILMNIADELTMMETWHKAELIGDHNA